jgi:hypothetical protein
MPAKELAMHTDISRLLDEMRDIQEQLERHFDSARETFRYSVENGRVRISREVQKLQAKRRELVDEPDTREQEPPLP